MGVKRAVLVGINYIGTTYSLKGCINDVRDIHDLIKNNYGFNQIKILTERQATTSNILKQLEWLVADTKAGDVLFFHYSGHGSQMLDDSDDDYEPDGLDEIICPIDLDWDKNVIRDDDLKRIFNKVPTGVNLTVLLDCCHSGSGTDQANRYHSIEIPVKQSEYIEPEYSDDVGSRFLAPPVAAIKVEKNITLSKPRSVQNGGAQTSLLVSGCRANQTSADAYINGQYNGACTYYFIDNLKAREFNMSYKDLIDGLNLDMVRFNYNQRPELNGNKSLFDYKVFDPFMLNEEFATFSKIESDDGMNEIADTVDEIINITSDIAKDVNNLTDQINQIIDPVMTPLTRDIKVDNKTTSNIIPISIIIGLAIIIGMSLTLL